jgi:hypothetical protein
VNRTAITKRSLLIGLISPTYKKHKIPSLKFNNLKLLKSYIKFGR